MTLSFTIFLDKKILIEPICFFKFYAALSRFSIPHILMKSQFNKFYLKNLFTNELEQCSERDFDEIVTKHRSCYELVYDGANAQNFVADGEIEARRERG